MRVKASVFIVLSALSPAALGAQPTPVGCTPIEAEAVAPERLAQELQPLARGTGAAVPILRHDAGGVVWDLGDKRVARLSVYITRQCALGLSTYVTGGSENSSPDPNRALQGMADALRKLAPDWTASVKSGNVIAVTKGDASYTTDLRALLQARLDAGTMLDLAGPPVRAVFDGWLLFLVPKDASKALDLSVRSTVYPWAYYDLTPYGLPRLLAHFDGEKGAELWALPPR